MVFTKILACLRNAEWRTKLFKLEYKDIILEVVTFLETCKAHHLSNTIREQAFVVLTAAFIPPRRRTPTASQNSKKIYSGQARTQTEAPGKSWAKYATR